MTDNQQLFLLTKKVDELSEYVELLSKQVFNMSKEQYALNYKISKLIRVGVIA